MKITVCLLILVHASSQFSEAGSTFNPPFTLKHNSLRANFQNTVSRSPNFSKLQLLEVNPIEDGPDRVIQASEFGHLNLNQDQDGFYNEAISGSRRKRFLWNLLDRINPRPNHNHCLHRHCHWYHHGSWDHGTWHPHSQNYCEWVNHCHQNHF